jgi:hypothetical protein
MRSRFTMHVVAAVAVAVALTGAIFATAGEPTALPQVVTWPAPTGEKAFEDCTLQVENKPVFAYTATANRSAASHGVAPEQYGFACFDVTGTVRVVVKTVRKLERVTIRPASAGIKAVVKDNTASFDLTRPCKLSVEFNGSEKRPLMLFAGAPESYPGGGGEDRGQSPRPERPLPPRGPLTTFHRQGQMV